MNMIINNNNMIMNILLSLSNCVLLESQKIIVFSLTMSFDSLEKGLYSNATFQQ